MLPLQSGALRLRPPHPSRKATGLPAEPSCRYLRALQPTVRNQLPAPAAQPLTGPVADQIANTSRNIPWRPPRFLVGLAVLGLASEGGPPSGLVRSVP
jgi:hypothetical protein